MGAYRGAVRGDASLASYLDLSSHEFQQFFDISCQQMSAWGRRLRGPHAWDAHSLTVASRR